jgi:hypothetical protein
MASNVNQLEPEQASVVASPLVGDRTPLPSPTLTLMEHGTPPSTEPDLDHDHEEDESLRFRMIDNVLGPVVVPGLAERRF